MTPTGLIGSVAARAVNGCESVARARDRAADPEAVRGPFVVGDDVSRAEAAAALALRNVSFPSAIGEALRDEVDARDRAALLKLNFELRDDPSSWREWVDATRERERKLPTLGSGERPYDLFLPAWLDARARERGEDLQAIADSLFRVKVRVVVVG